VPFAKYKESGKSRRMRWAGCVRRRYTLLVLKPEGKRSLERPRHRCVDNIKMDLLEIVQGCVDCIGLAQDRD
jgi:hypothetical protein